MLFCLILISILIEELSIGEWTLKLRLVTPGIYYSSCGEAVDRGQHIPRMSGMDNLFARPISIFRSIKCRLDSAISFIEYRGHHPMQTVVGI